MMGYVELTIVVTDTKEREFSMKDLVRLLILGGALSVMVSAAVAKPVENLHCGQPKCTYKEEMDGLQTTKYQGSCNGKELGEYTMACHPERA